MRNIILFIAISIIGIGCCKPVPKDMKPLSLKTEYLRIGFFNGKETYLQIQGTGSYSLKYNDLYMNLYDSKDLCLSSSQEKIVSEISFYSVISEEEYKLKYLEIKPNQHEDPIQ